MRQGAKATICILAACALLETGCAAIESANRHGKVTASISLTELRHKGYAEVMADELPVFIVYAKSAAIDRLQKLDEHVYAMGPEAAGIDMDNSTIFAVVGVSPYSKCKLEFVPYENNGRHWDKEKWLGGYWSLCHGEVFDIAGRQIKPGRFSPSAFPLRVGDLEPARIRITGGHVEVLSDGE